MARKQKKIHYIYKTTCIITGRYYIGMHSTCNIDDGYMGSGKRLRYSIRKHGVDNHVKEILEFFENRELLVEGEIKAITADMISENNCMNLKVGGTGGFANEEHRKKAQSSGGNSYKNKLNTDFEFRESHNKRVGENLKKAHREGKFNYGYFLGKQHSDEIKQKISDTKKGTGIGETNSQYGTCWITKDGVNKKIKKEELETYLNEEWVRGRK
jgi:hypothetical protein